MFMRPIKLKWHTIQTESMCSVTAHFISHKKLGCVALHFVIVGCACRKCHFIWIHSYLQSCTCTGQKQSLNLTQLRIRIQNTDAFCPFTVFTVLCCRKLFYITWLKSSNLPSFLNFSRSFLNCLYISMKPSLVKPPHLFQYLSWGQIQHGELKYICLSSSNLSLCHMVLGKIHKSGWQDGAWRDWCLSH